jgi:hypothetical protein
MLKTSPGGQSALTTFEKKLAGRNPDDSVVPAPVRKATRWMLAGAGVTAVIGVFSVIVAISDPRALNNGTQPSGGQLGQALVYYLITTVVFMAIWVLMARLNRAGQKWARIVASVLFAIATFDLYRGVNSLQGGQTILVLNVISFALAVAEWICGLGAIALLWRSESSIYFTERTAQRSLVTARR